MACGFAFLRYWFSLILQQITTFWLRLTQGFMENVNSFWLRLTEMFTSIHRSPNSELQLPLINADSPSIIEIPKMRILGVLVFALAIIAIVGLVYLHKLEDLAHELIITGVLVFVTLLYNGLVWWEIVPGLGNFLQSLGITCIMCGPCFVAGILFSAVSSFICWVCAVFNLIPFLYNLQSFF